MSYSTPEQLCFPPVAGLTVRGDFDGGALSSDSGPGRNSAHANLQCARVAGVPVATQGSGCWCRGGLWSRFNATRHDCAHSTPGSPPVRPPSRHLPRTGLPVRDPASAHATLLTPAATPAMWLPSRAKAATSASTTTSFMLRSVCAARTRTARINLSGSSTVVFMVN